MGNDLHAHCFRHALPPQDESLPNPSRMGFAPPAQSPSEYSRGPDWHQVFSVSSQSREAILVCGIIANDFLANVQAMRGGMEA